MRIQIINGPNLNLLGVREPEIYGKRAWEDYLKELRANKIHEVGFDRDGIVLNAGAYTHTSIAILDALRSVSTPTVEVHISNVYQREEFRRRSIISPGCMGFIGGFGLDSYRLAIEALIDNAKHNQEG